MRFLKSWCLVLFTVAVQQAGAQRIVYSEPDRDDTRRMNFEIIGKISGNFLVYKNLRGKSAISVYNNDMEQIDGNRTITWKVTGSSMSIFFLLAIFRYMVYQYQRRNVVYCNAVKVDGNGKKASEIMQIDTSHIGFSANNKIYSAITSEDRSKILLSKINSRNRSIIL
jgi:hypothetical protein